jgi:ribonuclease P protein component
MLPKTNRLKKKKDFETVFKKGKNFKNKAFVLKFAKNGLDYNRFGFIVSQKVSKKAVIRNKIRRRLSEILKIYTNDMEQGIDLVFIALAASAKNNFSDTRDYVHDIFIKTKLIKNV